MTDLPSNVDDAYNGKLLVFTSGALADKAMIVTDYVRVLKSNNCRNSIWSNIPVAGVV